LQDSVVTETDTSAMDNLKCEVSCGPDELPPVLFKQEC